MPLVHDPLEAAYGRDVVFLMEKNEVELVSERNNSHRDEDKGKNNTFIVHLLLLLLLIIIRN